MLYFTNSVAMVHVHGACAWCMCMVHVHGACANTVLINNGAQLVSMKSEFTQIYDIRDMCFGIYPNNIQIAFYFPMNQLKI